MLDNELLTIEDVAAYLRLRPQTIYKWAQKKQIPGAKFGKEWRFKRSEILAWVNRRMTEGNQEGSHDAEANDPAKGARQARRPRSAGRKKGKEGGAGSN